MRTDDPSWPRAHEPTTARGLLRHYLSDLIYGANDGLITTFAVASGVAGAALPVRVVLILGFANLLADGFSMGASNFLSIRSREDVRTADRADRGLEDAGPAEPFPFRHGAATFVSFVVVGAVPLAAYLLPGLGPDRFPVAVVFTLVTLFVVGAARSLVTARGWLRSGLEMLLVGAAAAAVAYGVGALVAALVGGGAAI